MEKTFETKEVVIKNLVTEGLQIRVEMNEDCIGEYADIYRSWKDLSETDKLPPITVYYDSMGDEHYLADGFHRVIAARRAGWKKITANVYEGTRDEALKFALGANAKHGLHRTNADKRNAMEIAWANREAIFKCAHPTERHFALVCGVSNGTAHNFLEKSGLLKMSKTGRAVSPLTAAFDSTTQLSLNGECGHAGTREHTVPTVLTATRDHLEERNETVRALLTDGKDRFGADIPERIKSAFLSRGPRMMLRDLGHIRETLDKARLERDIAYAHSIDYALRDLDATIRALRNGQPFCVCRMCRGKGCGSCSDLGFQTKLQYKRVPREYKAEEK